jgi:AcrR family transcriptional regulator
MAPGNLNARVSLRERTRDAVRSAIAGQALLLFDEQGFDATTVDEIADVAGISVRSFFRYFPSKEDTVLYEVEPLGADVRDALALRPATESCWAALLNSLEPVVQMVEGDPIGQLRLTRVAISTPALRARSTEKHIAWAALLTPLMAGRDGATGDTLKSRSVIHAGLACMDLALQVWAEEENARPFSTYLQTAFATIAEIDAG